ncbi:MAG: amino acid racemase [Myxococcales bacterium]|nr:amino acid racemase [Myxococcales bacterium]
MSEHHNDGQGSHRPHVGIVACTAEGAALCYRTLCLEGAAAFGRHAHPETSLHGHCLADYVERIQADDWNGVANLMLSSADKLAAAGAELLICPDNTIHQAMPAVEPRSPRPWLHIAQVVATEAERKGFAKVGVLGTRSLMEGPVYPEALAPLGIEALIPGKQERLEIDRIIFDELINGLLSDTAQARFREIIAGLRGQGCQAVALACTEIPLLVTAEDSPLPILDSTRLLARAALAWSAARSVPAKIRTAETSDVAAIVDIYNYEVSHATTTFATELDTSEARKTWLANHRDAELPVTVAESEGEVIGWACLSSWSERGAYRRSAEVSVYIHRTHRGRGLGRALLSDLVERARRQGFGVLLARICAADGPMSERLHRSLGFSHVGTMRRVGEKFGRLLDVELYEQQLDGG